MQLVRHAPRPLRVVVVDPAERPGRGLAYRTADPDHRLNAPTFGHSLLPDDAWHLSRWVVAHRLRESDPECLRPDGTVYLRRGDFGRYLEATFDAHRQGAASGSVIEHRRARAVALSAPREPLAVHLDDGTALAAAQVLLATGNPPLRWPAVLSDTLRGHPALVADPLNTPLPELDPHARVAVLGAGLTALDQLSTLVRRGHRGPITVLSRSGRRPRGAGPLAGALATVQRLEDLDSLPPQAMMARLSGPPPAWLQGPLTVRHWTRALRRRIAELQAAGGAWQHGFDELRDAVWQLWPQLPAAEQRRYLQRLRGWYEVHRFRTPPANDELVAQAPIAWRSGRLVQARADGPAIEITWQPPAGAPVRAGFDLLINCTGLDVSGGHAANPLLAAAEAKGRLRPDACGLGYAVDAMCRAIDATGHADPRLRLYGPPTLGSHGDPAGAIFIGAQVWRTLPALWADINEASWAASGEPGVVG